MPIKKDVSAKGILVQQIVRSAGQNCSPEDLAILFLLLSIHNIGSGKPTCLDLLKNDGSCQLDDSKIDNWVRTNIDHIHHYQSMCRMTRTQSEGGVVDPKGNAFGVKNLVIADASIIPYTVDGNTCGAAVLSRIYKNF